MSRAKKATSETRTIGGPGRTAAELDGIFRRTAERDEGAAPPIHLEELLARNLRELLRKHGMRQADLSARMRANGLRWTPNTPAQVLNQHRQLTLVELAALCSVFDQPLTRFLAGEDIISVGFRNVPVAMLRDLIEKGNSAIKVPPVTYYIEEPTPEEFKAMERLDIDLPTLRATSKRLFGTANIAQERDRRAGDLSSLPPRTAQTKRGHAMRRVLAELEQGKTTSSAARRGRSK